MRHRLSSAALASLVATAPDGWFDAALSASCVAALSKTDHTLPTPCQQAILDGKLRLTVERVSPAFIPPNAPRVNTNTEAPRPHLFIDLAETPGTPSEGSGEEDDAALRDTVSEVLIEVQAGLHRRVEALAEWAGVTPKSLVLYLITEWEGKQATANWLGLNTAAVEEFYEIVQRDAEMPRVERATSNDWFALVDESATPGHRILSSRSVPPHRSRS